MPRPHIVIPLTNDLLSLQTLLESGLNNPQIREYYVYHGITISERTLVRKIKELRETNEQDQH